MAGRERIHRTNNPSLQPAGLHSNSVPSTPLQHASDLRFSSRSPSPTRPIAGRRSPIPGVVKGRPAAILSNPAPSLCKFESGAEFRKRRIPYKDGGNDPLPPPKKEPKKTLTTGEEDKLSADMRELYNRLLPSDESEGRRSALIKKLERILDQEWPGSDIKVHVFGSSGNLLSSSDSDVDICITTSLRELESMHSLATVLDRNGMERVVCRAAAKVPIVKMWDPELQLACDMNVNNTLALENTRMIKTYVQIDKRVRPLAKIIKYWTKQRILNDAAFGGTISSYTWICMIINFLQCRKPPVLPSLQQLRKCNDTNRSSTSQFEDNLDVLKDFGKANHETLGTLLFHFFRFYGYEIDYQECVVSVRQARLLPRKEKGWNVTNYQDKEARSRLCVEEPFNINRNLGNSADDYAFSGIHEEIRRAFDLIAQGKLDECCTEYVFPPEEKTTIFQRPVAKPKPILTRSASQSGRSHANSVGSKTGGKDNRNQRASSAHRGNSRRASSGASFGPPRHGFMSPTVPLNGYDYFGAAMQLPNEQLHEQLSKQYQALQAQQEILTNQLLQQQHIQAVQARAQLAQGMDMHASSPRQRQFVSGLPSQRTFEASPVSAPLLPGYLYHYPARYPPAGASILQTRTQDGSLTHPSSPALSTRAPHSRRSTLRSGAEHPTSVPSTRSQSQPGRSLPSPATIQSMTHPGYDVSGAIGNPYLMRQPLQMYPYHGALDPMNPLAGSYDNPMPKEYVGYYLQQSPQLLLQNMLYPSQVPRMRDVPLRQNKPSPERIGNNRINGSHQRSRSPSPIPRTTTASKPAPTLETVSKPQSKEPVIANGSTPRRVIAAPLVVATTPVRKSPSTISATANGLDLASRGPMSVPTLESPVTGKDAHRTRLDVIESLKQSARDRDAAKINGNIADEQKVLNRVRPVPVEMTEMPINRPLPPLVLSSNGIAPQQNGEDEISEPPHLTPTIAAPLLSPVVELQSPPSSRGNDSPRKAVIPQTMTRERCLPNGQQLDSVWTTKLTSGPVKQSIPQPKPAEHPKISPKLAAALPLQAQPQSSSNKRIQQPVAPPTPAPVSPAPALQQVQPPAPPQRATTNAAGQWQQATAKRHRKNKSQGALNGEIVNGSVNAGSRAAEVMPERESERKGG